MIGKSLDDVEFVFFDTETTGLNPRAGDRVIEIAAVRLRADTRLGSFSTLVNPGRLVSEGAFRVNHISDEMLKDAPRIEDVAPDFLAFIEGGCLCSYNAPFDIGFLESELAYAGRDSAAIREGAIVDVLRMSRRLMPGLEKYALWFVADALGIEKSQEHRALADVEMTIDVFRKFRGMLQDKGIADYRNFVRLFAVAGKHLESAYEQSCAQLQEAIDAGARLSVRYFSAVDGRVTRRTIVPKVVRREGNTSYLVAFCTMRNDDRLFRIDGLLDVEIV